jgi:hypothetical protein
VRFQTDEFFCTRVSEDADRHVAKAVAEIVQNREVPRAQIIILAWVLLKSDISGR